MLKKRLLLGAALAFTFPTWVVAQPGSLHLTPQQSAQLDRLAAQEIRATSLANPKAADSRANAVFLLRGNENQPVGAELRGTRPVRWLGLAPCSRKNLGYFSLQAPGATIIVLCESAIDTISCFLLTTRGCAFGDFDNDVSGRKVSHSFTKGLTGQRK